MFSTQQSEQHIFHKIPAGKFYHGDQKWHPQKSAPLFLCVYYALNEIRVRYGKHAADNPAREIERKLSEHAKKFNDFSLTISAYVVIILYTRKYLHVPTEDDLSDFDYLNKMPLTKIQHQAILERCQSLTATLINGDVINDLILMLQQLTAHIPKVHLQTNAACDELSIDQDKFNELRHGQISMMIRRSEQPGREPSQMTQVDSVVTAGDCELPLPDLMEAMFQQVFTELDRAINVNSLLIFNSLSMLMYNAVEKYNLHFSSWTPDKPFDNLIHCLAQQGPLVIFGFFGPAFYPAPATMVNDESLQQQVYDFPEQDFLSDKRENGHAMTVIGAAAGEDNQAHIYYLLPDDAHAPGESRKIYRMPYELLRLRCANVFGLSLHSMKTPEQLRQVFFKDLGPFGVFGDQHKLPRTAVEVSEKVESKMIGITKAP